MNSNAKLCCFTAARGRERDGVYMHLNVRCLGPAHFPISYRPVIGLIKVWVYLYAGFIMRGAPPDIDKHLFDHISAYFSTRGQRRADYSRPYSFPLWYDIYKVQWLPIQQAVYEKCCQYNYASIYVGHNQILQLLNDR